MTGADDGSKQGGKPSASKTYKTLAQALVARDSAKFVPGKSNLDWRKHLVKG